MALHCRLSSSLRDLAQLALVCNAGQCAVSASNPRPSSSHHAPELGLAITSLTRAAIHQSRGHQAHLTLTYTCTRQLPDIQHPCSWLLEGHLRLLFAPLLLKLLAACVISCMQQAYTQSFRTAIFWSNKGHFSGLTPESGELDDPSFLNI